jgi:hypothetical protein
MTNDVLQAILSRSIQPSEGLLLLLKPANPPDELFGSMSIGGG